MNCNTKNKKVQRIQLHLPKDLLECKKSLEQGDSLTFQEQCRLISLHDGFLNQAAGMIARNTPVLLKGSTIDESILEEAFLKILTDNSVEALSRYTSADFLFREIRREYLKKVNGPGYDLSRIIYRAVNALVPEGIILRDDVIPGKKSFLRSCSKLKHVKCKDSANGDFSAYEQSKEQIGIYYPRKLKSEKRQPQILSDSQAQELVEKILLACNGEIFMQDLMRLVWNHIPENFKSFLPGTTLEVLPEEAAENQTFTEELYRKKDSIYQQELLSFRLKYESRELAGRIWEQAQNISRGKGEKTVSGVKTFCLYLIPELFFEAKLTKNNSSPSLASLGDSSNAQGVVNDLGKVLRKELDEMYSDYQNNYTKRQQSLLADCIGKIFRILNHCCSENGYNNSL